MAGLTGGASLTATGLSSATFAGGALAGAVSGAVSGTLQAAWNGGHQLLRYGKGSWGSVGKEALYGGLGGAIGGAVIGGAIGGYQQLRNNGTFSDLNLAIKKGFQRTHPEFVTNKAGSVSFELPQEYGVLSEAGKLTNVVADESSTVLGLPEAFYRFSKFEKHYLKHVVQQEEFGAASKLGYYNRAISLMDGKIGNNVVGFTNSSGYTFRMNMQTSEFGVMRPNGVIETFFRRLKDPSVYWAEQLLKYGK